MKAADHLLKDLIASGPEAAARAFERLPIEEAAKVLARLPDRSAETVLERLMPPSAVQLLRRLPGDRGIELLGRIAPRAAVAIVHHMDDPERQALLARTEPPYAVLRDLLRHAADTAGAMMDPQVTTIPSDVTVREAIAALRRVDRKTIFYLYVVDRERRLVGIVTMRDLLLAAPREPVDALMLREVTRVPASMSRDQVADLMRQRRFLALPVVDEEGRLVGVVRHEQLVQAVQQEALEDIARMVGAGGDETALSPVSTVVRRRLPWLVVNLGTAFAAAAVVGVFEGIIAKVTALAVLLPVVAGQAGNSGSQSLAVVMRGLTLKEIPPGGWMRVLWKEAAGGFFNGLAIAAITALAVMAWSRSGGLALVIGVAMVINMMAAGVAGAAIPIALRCMGRDPAQSSTIFLTTVTDMVGFAAFLGLAVVFAGLLT